MFEQSLYNQEPVAQPLQPGELFHNYELKNWDLSTRIYQIVGISAVANILAILIFAQTSVLTTKTCDSPLVGSVCQFLDTVYVGAMIFGTNREYVDEAYEKTELGNADITYVDVTGLTPPLSYPEGYFQVANPQEYAMIQQQAENPAFPPNMAGFPGIPSSNFPTIRPSTGNSLFDTKPSYPKRIRDPLGGGKLPGIDDSGVADVNPGMDRKNPRNNRPSNVSPKNPDGSIPGIPNSANVNPIANANIDPTKNPMDDSKDVAKADKNGIYLNKQPLTKFAERVKPVNDVIRPDAIFKVVISGDLAPGKDKNGKETNTIVLRNPKPIETVAGTKASAEMAKLAQDGILAVGDSGWFGYLNTLGVKKVIITVVQDATDFKVTVRADQKDEATARTVASGLYTLISIGRGSTDGDEKTFLEKTNTTFEGKSFLLNFTMPKAEVLEMIKRKLAEPEKKQNSTAQTTTTDSTSSK